ncbi:hypothetical protein Vadar_026838 [Vaccinium darrowii]|uniref:Uncharacterized protein n=1 Tax=Vaccinium darrowii TaxID=229202 RepID=A0ACB7YPR5_9ERIC|nr:hypothetical protein Vadar_026838 [Vaccinium darrowii]
MGSEINENLLTNGNHEGEEKLKDKLWIETKKMWVVAAPAIFTRFSNFRTQIIGLAFIGHIGATELAAYALVVIVILMFYNGILSRTLVQHGTHSSNRKQAERRGCHRCFLYLVLRLGLVGRALWLMLTLQAIT